jgi:hypothetical protein
MLTKTLVLNVPTFGFMVATRAMIGAGIGMLVGARLPANRRRAVALALIAVGAVSTVPGLRAIFRDTRQARLTTDR